ncbi:helix-turn-helix transcriptional regulator [Pseudomaricurvus alcaniphilus]|uniref:winged helix-turn-helix transcriptional regulator n=1 Tax=Pseudomaricurvus alcaniphilus TaxID=1166482 RepID=UPI00140E4F7A|nr:helix-turn-helix domain-containing protein [Pseudomaricurvus alcaniphilus]NHN39021.1 helix-turn-helix transcriptional regulator [Pseudomaricurvus alcaniphilus]
MAEQIIPRPIAVQRTLAIFSDPWSFSVLQELFFGVRKFDDFQRNLGISRSVLARRLKHLEQEQIIGRHLYSDRPKRYEYKLTERGRDMYPIFIALRRWGETWLDNAATPELKLVHKTCGHELIPSLDCAACQKEIKAEDIAYQVDA